PHLRSFPPDALPIYTQFGCLLREKQIAVVHIPLKAVHTGLNSFEVFISHQKSALENLLHLIENYPDFPGKLVYWARVVQKIPILDRKSTRLNSSHVK